MKKKKCAKGGPLENGGLLTAGLSLIPGVGQLLGPLSGIVSNIFDKPDLEQMKPDPKMQLNLNPYGKMKYGGIVNDGFKQYNTGSHKSGNDLSVDAEGNPNMNGENSVQNKENSYPVKNKQYVMSDVLKNPKTGNTFNKDAMSINKKYPKARTSLDQRKALDLEMQFLASLNDAERNAQLDKELIYGGYTNGDTNGDPTIPASSNLQFYSNPETLNGVTVPTLYPKPVASQPSIVEPTTNNDLPLDTTSFGNEISTGKNITDTFIPQVNNPQPIKSDNTNWANAVGLGLKGAALIGSILDAKRPAEQEKLILPDYQASDRYIKSANIDYTQAKQDALGISNIAGQTNRSLSSNAASFQGREQARLASLSDAISKISEAQNNEQSQLNVRKGIYEQQKAVDTANRKYQNQQNQQMNDANSRFFDRDLMANLSELGSSFNKYAETQKAIKNNKELSQFQINQSLAILNSKYPNFKVDSEVINLIKSGASIDDIIKMKG